MMEWPQVSVVMVVRNERAFIEKSLGAVLLQDYPEEHYEVVVADGQSDDGTRAYLESIQAQHTYLQVIDNPQRIVSTGLNAAIAKAKGALIVRVDGHTIVAPDYVRQCVAELQATPQADNVGGKMAAVGQGLFGEGVALATSSPFGVGGARFHYSDEKEWVDTVYMGAWRRDLFDRIGLFDEELVRDQDDEFNYRLRAAGGKILLSPQIKSRYTVRSTPQALWRQYYQYGFWKVRVLQKHPRQMRLRQFLPPTLAAGLLVSLGLACFGGWALVAPVLAFGGYGLANLAASLLLARQWGWRYLRVLPAIFTSLHVGYGLGFLVGLIRFWDRWGDKVGKVPHRMVANA